MAYDKGYIEVEILEEWDFDTNDYDDEHNLKGKLVAKLPHSCNKWIIGGKYEVETMIEDLKAALDKLE